MAPQTPFWLRFWRLSVGFYSVADLFRAIEVKRSARIDTRDLAGLMAFGADDPKAQRWLLILAPKPLRIDGIRCEPLEPCLRQLRP